jgi:hypothetical protein
MTINNCGYQIPNHKKGDTWEGLDFLIEEENPDYDPTVEVEEGEQPIPQFLPVDLTGVAILIQFRLTNDNPVVFEFATTDNTIEILYPLTGVFSLVPRILNVAHGRYVFDVQFTYPNGKVFTPFGGSMTITNDISRR